MEKQSAINPNMDLIESIWQNHLSVLKAGNMDYNPKGRRFASKQEVAAAIRNGEIIPEIWKEVAHHTLGPAQIIGMHSLLSFSSPKVEAKFKASFIACIENLLS